MLSPTIKYQKICSEDQPGKTFAKYKPVLLRTRIRPDSNKFAESGSKWIKAQTLVHKDLYLLNGLQNLNVCTIKTARIFKILTSAWDMCLPCWRTLWRWRSLAGGRWSAVTTVVDMCLPYWRTLGRWRSLAGGHQSAGKTVVDMCLPCWLTLWRWRSLAGDRQSAGTPGSRPSRVGSGLEP